MGPSDSHNKSLTPYDSDFARWVPDRKHHRAMADQHLASRMSSWTQHPPQITALCYDPGQITLTILEPSQSQTIRMR